MSLPQPALSWVWLVDLERTVALLVGRCLGGMLQGAPTSLEEQDTAYWLKTPLFSNGLEMDIPQLGREDLNSSRIYCARTDSQGSCSVDLWRWMCFSLCPFIPSFICCFLCDLLR